MDILKVVRWTGDDVFEMIDWIGSNQRLRNHVIQSLTCLVQVDLPEQFKSSLIDHVYFIVDLLVVSDLSINYTGIVDDPTVVDLRLVDMRVNQVPVQIVELV